MSRLPIIRTLSTTALLLLFFFSITPTTLLHQLFAQHEDSYGFVNKQGTETVAPDHINCHCDSPVVNTEFISPVYAAALFVAGYGHNNTPLLTAPAVASAGKFMGLRGPPAGC